MTISMASGFATAPDPPSAGPCLRVVDDSATNSAIALGQADDAQPRGLLSLVSALRIAIAADLPDTAVPILETLRDLGIEPTAVPQLSLNDSYSSLVQGAAEADLVILTSAGSLLPYCATIERLVAAKCNVVVIGRCDPQSLLETMRAGAQDYLDAGPQLEVELHMLLRRVAANCSLRIAKRRLYSVVGVSGGCGVSVLAVNLAAALARRAGTCGLLDLQLRGGDLATLLSIEPRHTITDLLAAHESFDRVMFQQSLHEHASGVQLLAGPELFDRARQTSPQAIRSVVDAARESFEHIVVDLEDAFHTEQLRTLCASDAVLVVLRMDFNSLVRGRKYIAHIQRAGIEAERIRVIANRVTHACEVPLQKAAKVLGVPVAHTVPEDQVHVLKSIHVGNPTVVEFPRCPFSKAVEHMSRSILGEQPVEESWWRSLISTCLPKRR